MNFKRVYFIFSFAWLLLAPNLFAQEKIFKSDKITSDNGLSHSAVNCILQDKYGFLWFGTWNGLNRYDGYDMTVYLPDDSDPASISNNIINCIYQDNKGLLWIGTDFGLNCFNQDNGKFKHYLKNEKDSTSINSNQVLTLVQDSQGIYWIGTRDGGLNKLDTTTGKFESFNNDYSNDCNYVFTIMEDNINQNYLWIGTEQGLFRFDKQTETFYKVDSNSSYSWSTILAIQQDPNGNLYMGTWGGGLIKFDRKTGRLINCFAKLPAGIIQKYGIINSVLMDLYGNLWIGTRNGGIMKFNPHTNQFMDWTGENDYKDISDKVICSLYQNTSDIIWAGTQYDGVYKIMLQPKKFRNFSNKLIDPDNRNQDVIMAVLEDSKGDLWLGSRNNGLIRVNNNTKQSTFYTHNPRNSRSLSNDNILSLFETHDNGKSLIWIGTDGGGLNCYNPVTNSFTSYQLEEGNEHSLSNNHVYSIARYDKDHLLIGTWGLKWGGGLDIFDLKTERFINLKNDPSNPKSISSNIVLDIFKDKSGTIWIGTKNGGLNKLIIKNINAASPDKIGYFIRYLHKNGDTASLSNNTVYSIYEDVNGMLWIGTNGGGLNRFNRTSGIFKTYTLRNKLADNVIFGILEDDNNNLWMSTSKGLIRFNPNSEAVRNFDKFDGLQDNAFNLGAYCKTRSGEMIFGSINGCSIFYPDSIKSDQNIPEIAITKFIANGHSKSYTATTLSNHSLNTLKSIRIPHDLNNLYFEFAVLDFNSPLKNNYRYQLKGYDHSPISTDAHQRFASYTNLKPGKYVFVVTGSNEDDVWNREGISIEIIISPPFWGTLGFKLFIILMILGLISFTIFILISKYQREKIRVEEEARESILDERNQLRTLIDNMPDSIYIKDRESRFIVGNKKVATIMGTTTDGLVGKSDFDFYTRDLASRFYEDEQAIMRAGEPKINYEEPGLDEQGNRVIISTTKVPLKNINGEVVGIVGIGRDITRLKRVEIQLRKKTEDLQETNRLLEERQEEIQQQSEELASQAESLRQINSELERLNRTKDKFFSIIAHDLRNPFHAIIGFSELLRKDFYEMDNQQKLGLLELINVSSESAFNLLENLLQWARTQTDKIKFNPENFDIGEMVKSVINFHNISAEKKRVVLRSSISPHTLVYADKNMINTVVRNLISNAIKFSKAKGEILVSAQEINGKIEFDVTDHGIGMSKDNLNKLFRIDTYHSTTGTSGESGTGLGLIICKEFIEKNSGRLKVTSEEGAGSTFSFFLEKARH